jgi:hypothetical protein
MIAALESIKLKVLVFGPSSTPHHPPGFTADLANKRVQIRDALIGDGHEAAFPEDLMHGSIDPSLDNPYIWEQVLVREYDMVVSLVGSFGAVSELSLFMRENLALKAALFFNQDHCDGLAYAQAQAIRDMGATLEQYTYPADLHSCNLMTYIQEKVRAVRVGKFFS